MAISSAARVASSAAPEEFPSVALQQIDGAWFVVEDNAEEPDGYFVEQDGALVIDESAESGLPITLDGPLVVGT